MFDRTSRYSGLPLASAVVTGADGQPRTVRYVTRRFIPPAESAVTLATHLVAQNDRVDSLTARYFNDPTQLWRICDANGVLRVAELTDPPGRALRVPLPGVSIP